MSTFLQMHTRRQDIGIRVITYHEPGAPNFYKAPDKKFRFSMPFDPANNPRTNKVTKVVLHHDGMRNSRGCFNVLLNRGLSTHIMIDRDGTVYQPLDLSHTAWHAGSEINRTSVGIDLNNPIHPRRDPNPAERGTYHGRINGGRMSSLGYTDAQYESLNAVLNGLFQLFVNIKRAAPVGDDGKVVRRKLLDLSFSGVVGHLHVSANKWDPGPGFNWERLLVGIRGNRLFFPVTLPGAPNLSQVPKEHALRHAEPYFRNTEEGQSGFFPVGVNQGWHTGAHFNVKPGTPVYAPAAGHIMVARNTDPQRMGSPNVVVIRHDLEFGSIPRRFFTVISHMKKAPMGPDSPIKWISTFAKQGGPVGLPEDGHKSRRQAAPGHVALIDGRVALAKVPVKPGELIGYAGEFTPRTDGTGRRGTVDVAVISTRPLFRAAELVFKHVDEDPDPGLLCNARSVWKHFVSKPAVLNGLVEGGYPIAPETLRAFYNEGGRSEAWRWTAVRHVTEWNVNTDFSGLFGGGVDFEWFTRKEAERYIAQIQKFLWWDQRVSDHTELPDNGLVWAYQPVALLSVLAKGEARAAFSLEEGVSAAQGLTDDQLRQARVRDAVSEKEAHGATRHGYYGYKDITGGRDLDDDDGEDGPEREGWMRWEQGEWEPEE